MRPVAAFVPRGIFQLELSRNSRILKNSSLLQPLGIGQDRYINSSHGLKTHHGTVQNETRDSKMLNLDASSLSRMSISALMRNIVLGFVFTSPKLLRTILPMISKIANSKSMLLNPDRNPILRIIIKPIVYAQFCAGTNKTEIAKTREINKAIGFSGVVLCFGKECQESKVYSNMDKRAETTRREIAYWKNGTLETISFAREGDWIGIKFTGAGSDVASALADQTELPQDFEEAVTLICERARSQNCRIWIDAEQQLVQKGIDNVALRLMRRYNRDSNVLIYNTLQAYLKDSRAKLKRQLALAHAEGWELAVKLVRGAYIATDPRDSIHDTKSDTDASYNGLVSDILQGTNLDFPRSEFPPMQLLIAGHNPASIIGAFHLSRELHQNGTLKVQPDFAQLQGMADMLGCDLIRRCEETRSALPQSENGNVPKVYKCLTWGSVQECIHYLMRRMVENSSASDRIHDGFEAYIDELRRRLIGR